MKEFTSKTQKVGELGEQLARRYLDSLGLKFIESNYGFFGGEIDLVFKQGDVYWLIEVKSALVSFDKSDLSSWPVWQNFSKSKLNKLERTRWHYLHKKSIDPSNCLLKGVVVLIDKQKLQAKCEVFDLF